MAKNAIKIQQAPMEVTFKYGNVTRNSSKRGGTIISSLTAKREE